MEPSGYYALAFVLIGVILVLSLLTIPGSPSFPNLSLNIIVLYAALLVAAFFLLRSRRR